MTEASDDTGDRAAPRRGRSRWWLAAVAVIAAAAVALIAWRMSGRRTTRRARPVVVVPHALPVAIELTLPRGDVGAPLELRWQPVAAAAGYRVSVFTAQGQALFTRDVLGPPLPWPSAIPTPPGDYRWQVEARDAHGIVGTSPMQPFRILP